MEGKNNLTNENLTKQFKSNFQLVNYAIKLAKNMIKTGRDPRISEAQNRAMFVLKEIEEGKDQLLPEHSAQHESVPPKAQEASSADEGIEPESLMNEPVYANKFSYSDEEE